MIRTFSDAIVVYDNLIVTLGGVMLLTLALLGSSVVAFVGRNIAPRVRENRLKELFRIAYWKSRRDDRLAREVIIEEGNRAFDDQFRNITDPIEREFKRRHEGET